MVQNKEAHRAVIAARTKLVLDEPFWGMLSSRLAVVEDPSCNTAWTDGVSLGYNPQFVLEQTFAQLLALMAHETEHCARGHPWRRGARQHERFNIAADLAINCDLRRCGYKLPDGALFPEQYKLPEGKSAEWYYDRLPADAGKGKSGDGDGKGDGSQQDGPGSGKPDPLGEVRDAPKGGEGDESIPTEEDWRQAVVQAAAIVGGQGKLPAGLERIVEDAKQLKIDWQSALLRYAQEIARNDYSWSRPSKRYAAHGLYMPQMHSTEVGTLAVFIDTSGSVDQVLLNQFSGVVKDIRDQIRPRRVRIGYVDAKLHREDVFEQDDELVMKPCGGGGTDFRPAFDAVGTWDEEPVCIIYLTDLYGTFPEQDPGIPTIWVTPEGNKQSAPFGETLRAA